MFAKAARILRKRDIVNERTVQRFESHLREVSELSESLLALDEILGDIPDEFTDGLLGTLMTDPVQLLQSKQFVDRSTINRQLMNKPVDPFSNTPLSVDQLIEQPELKAKIAAWIEERKAAWRADRQKEVVAAHDEEDDDDTHANSSVTSSSSRSSSSASTASAGSQASSRKSYLDD